jgi:hypothetical protein
MTLPYEKAFGPWHKKGFVLPGVAYEYVFEGKDIKYENIELSKNWSDYNIKHKLTDAGLDKFVSDWHSLIV